MIERIAGFLQRLMNFTRVPVLCGAPISNEDVRCFSAFLSESEVRNQKAAQEAKDSADDSQRIVDKKKARIHDFFVAAFGSAFTLFLEHLDDIVHFVQRLF